MATGTMDRTSRGWQHGLAVGWVVFLLTYATGAAAQTGCIGDCSGDGFVRVNELVTGVNITLERAPLDTCPSFDANGSDAVEVNELVTAVNNTLVGCPMVDPSPTPSDTTAPTETATSTPTSTITATPTLTVTMGTATPTGTVDETTPTPTIVVGTATPTGTVEEETPTPTIVVGTSTPTGTVEEETPTPTIIVGTATPTGTVIESTPTHSATPLPSATPTATSTPIESSPTVPPAARIAGSTTVAINSLGTIPTLISAIANGIDFGGASGSASGRDDGGIAAAACPGGGTATRTGNLFPNFNLNITLNSCRVPTADGFVTFNGHIVQSALVLTINDGASPTPGPLTAQYEDGTGMPTLLAEAQVTLTISGLPTLGGSCEITAVTFTAAGTISTTTSTGDSSTMTFSGTTVTVNMIVFSPSCVPTAYRLTFTGNAALLSSALAEPIDVTFSSLIFDVVDASGETTFSITGGMSSPCFGGAATISTQTLLAVPDDEVCPTEGQITATVSGNATRVIYNSDQSVGLDTSNDGTVDETYPHCQDPRLYECLA